MTFPERQRGIPLMALSSVLFACMAVLARMLATRLPSHQVVLLRFGVGLLCMGAYYASRRRLPDIPRPKLWALRGLLGGGAVFFYFLAIHKMEVGPATVLNYSSPIYAGVFAAFFLGERLTRNVLFGILIASCGSALVAVSASGGHLTLGTGALCGLLSAFLGGAAMTTVRSLRRDTSSGSIFVSFCAFGSLWALPFCWHDWVALDRRTLVLAVGVGLFSIAAQLVFTYAFRFVTAARGSATTQLTAAFTWLLGVAALGESLLPLAVLGAAVCVGGVLLSTGVFGREPVVAGLSSR
jgi:drug/metabolite transporter (DMT)-like permease